MSDLIDRQRAIEAVKLGITYAKLIDTETGELLEPFKASNDELKRAVQRIKNLPSAQPTFDARDTQYNLPIGTDCISRQQAIDAINGLIDMFEQILRDIREANVDDSVCGMCEYDGAYIGQSGDWCNECPGFDKDDCFKLSDKTRKKWTEEIIKALPPIQPEIIRCKDCKHWIPYEWMFSEVWQSKNIADYPEDEIGCDCSEVAMRANDFCSLAERKTE